MLRTKPIDVPRDWHLLKPHPLADLCEFGAGIDMDAIVADMMNGGYDERYPIVLLRENGHLWILNGRHRHQCAIRAEVVPTFVEYIGKDPRDEARRKIMQQHLTVSQRAAFAASLANLSQGETKHARQAEDVSQICNTEQPVTRAEAAKLVDVSPRAVDYATVVIDHGTEALKRAVRTGKVKVSDAANVARRSKPIQDYAVAQVEAGTFKTVTLAATLCKRCEGRIKNSKAPTKDCPACEDVRKNGKPKKAPAKKKEKPKPPPEQQTFGWAEYKAALTGLHTFIDTLSRKDKPQLHERLEAFSEAIGPEPTNGGQDEAEALFGAGNNKHHGPGSDRR